MSRPLLPSGVTLPPKALHKLQSEHESALFNLKSGHAEVLRTHAEALRKLDVEQKSALDTLKSAHAEVICIIYLVLLIMQVCVCVCVCLCVRVL